MKEILLTHNKVAIIDDDVIDLILEYKWRARKNKNRNTWYALGHKYIKGKMFNVKMHRLVMGKSTLQVDHIDCDGLNNQRSNLRFATQSQNSMNQRPQVGKASKYKGVHFNKNNKNFVSRIQINGTRIHIGVYVNEIDAAKAYDEKAKEIFGEFARLNFPNET